ncbi:MAG: hypothetical protein M3P06_20305 [Acidobacteriota bacterium]|nr:hypothetical protein [Acidobacteriota bacterium]
MADEVLLKEPLEDAMIREGEAITSQLEELGVPLTASFWLYTSERNEWMLTIASPMITSEGQRAVLDMVGNALEALELSNTCFNHISVIWPNEPVVRALSTLTPNGDLAHGKRFRGVLDRCYIDDAYLYRITPTAA